MDAFQIGWYEVKEDTEYTDRGYECAAWFKTLLVKAGKYPVMASKFFFNERDKRVTNEINDTSISIKLTGTVTADDFAGRFCGRLIGDNPRFNQYVGQQDCVILSPYAHATAKDILDGTSAISLLPEYEAQAVHFEYQGEPKKTYGIFKFQDVA